MSATSRPLAETTRTGPAARTNTLTRTLCSAAIVVAVFANTSVVGCGAEESTSLDATYVDALHDAGDGSDVCLVDASTEADCPQNDDGCGPCCRAWGGNTADSTRRCINRDAVRLACVPSGWASAGAMDCFVMPDGTLVRTPNVYSFDSAEFGIAECSDADYDWVIEVSWCE